MARFTKRTLAASLVEWQALPQVAFHQNIPRDQLERLIRDLQANGPGRVHVRHDGGARNNTTEYRWTPT